MQQDAAGPRPAGAARPRRPPPERNEHFDHLAVDELRAYRAEVALEEERVSYWRRVLQARIDIVRAGGAAVDAASLRRLLTSDRVHAGRTALVRVLPADGMPDLPDLAELWERSPVAGDDVGNAALLERLDAAEQQLSTYRTSLHRRLDAATRELVARYRERPALASRALPLDPPVKPRAAPPPAR